jgi:hypothetical protein
MKKVNLALNPPIADIQGNMVFASNGHVVLCYKTNLPEIHSLSSEDFDALHTTWFQAFKSLPVGCVVHKQDVYLEKDYDPKKLPGNSFLEISTRNYFKGRKYIAHSSYLFFTLVKNTALNNPKYVNPFRNPPKELVPKLDEHVNNFIGSVTDAVSFINNSRKLRLLPLNSEEITEITRDYFNGFNQAMDTDIVLNDSHLTIGDSHFEVLAVNSESCFGDILQSSTIDPDFTSDEFSFHRGFIDGLGLWLKENHIVNQIIYMDDTQKWRRVLDKKIEELQKSINFGTHNQVVLKKIKEIQEKINADDSAKLIRGHLNIVYWDSEPQRLKRIASKIKTAFKELDIFPYSPGGTERKNYFLNSYFGFSANFSNGDLYVGDLKHALCLWLNNTSYKSDATGIIFNDRGDNIPVLKDVWDEDKQRIKARNFAIFAPTGEGKSFLVLC